MYKQILFTVTLLISGLFIKAQQKISFRITENNIVTPCNIRISNEAGEYFFADSTYFWRAFYGTIAPDYPSEGKFVIQLPTGKYKFEIDRGPEYYYTRGEFEVADKDLLIEPVINKIADLKEKNWWSGELHVHRKVEDVERLMLAGNLHIAPVITSWNQGYNVKDDSIYDASPKKFDNDRYYTTTGSEDERAGGAILVFNTTKPVNFSKNKKEEYPSLAASIENVEKEFGKNHWIDFEKPFWWDLPILLPTGKLNSLGIAHNHMLRDGIYEGEGWGKPRDVEAYPSPMGNGYWTQELYYKVLNSGIRIVPSAGSASGVLLNPVGYNRIYAHVEGDFSYDKWFDAVGKGKTFISNGPIVICKANDKFPGETFTVRRKTTLQIDADIYSRDSIDFIEIIKNGIPYKRIDPVSIKENKISETISFDKSGWFLVRIINKNSKTFRFASTAPYYVEIGKNKKHISKSAVQFFLDWTNERASKIKVDSEEEKTEIFKHIDAARTFWQHLLLQANNE